MKILLIDSLDHYSGVTTHMSMPMPKILFLPEDSQKKRMSWYFWKP